MNHYIATNGRWTAILHMDNVIRVWGTFTGIRIDNAYACKHWFDFYQE